LVGVTELCVVIVFYARVSTTEQTTAHQRTQAEQAGFKIDTAVADEGISGVSTRLAEPPEGKRGPTCCALATRWSWQRQHAIHGEVSRRDSNGGVPSSNRWLAGPV
jgi:hypothetical protein